MSIASARTLTTTQRGLVQTAKVSFSGASSVSIDNCFSSSYTHYIVRRDFVGSSSVQAVNIRLRVNGVDASGANYRRQYIFPDSTSVTAGRVTGLTAFDAEFGYTETALRGFTETWISNPFEAVRTTMWVDAGRTQDGNINMISQVAAHDLATSYTGMTVIPGSGTITGTVTVYGLVVGASDSPVIPVDYLVVAGGGGGGRGGGNTRGGGGGGAGGYRSSTLSIQRGSTVAVTVGTGGNGVAGGAAGRGQNGGDSIFASVTAAGGGGGGEAQTNVPAAQGADGGSGGGASPNNFDNTIVGGSGNVPSTSPVQGYAGGSSIGFNVGGGGGGGSAGAGSNSTTGTGASGGPGTANTITGASVTYAAGGAGGNNSGTSAGANGTANTGNGGGGGQGGATSVAGGNGGSGVVVLRFPRYYTFSVSPGLTYSTTVVGANTVVQFTAGTGTVTF